MPYSRRLISTLSPGYKVHRLLFLTDLIALLCGGALFFNTFRLISIGYLQIAYGMIILILTIASIYQPRQNPKKRNYQVIQFAFKRDHHIYHSVMFNELALYDQELKDQHLEKEMIDLTKY